MRGIVIAKMLVLALWGLYLGVGLALGDYRSANAVVAASRCPQHEARAAEATR